MLDRAEEGHATRPLALPVGCDPVVPRRKTRLALWVYDRELDKGGTAVERLFRRLKGFRRIFSRLEKLAVSFLGFLVFALIFDALR